MPFDKLVLSQANVRHIEAGVSIEELAEDIARRTLLQSLMVRPVRDAEGAETGMFEIPAGGRRYRALALLVKQRRLAKIAPVPCVVREAGTPEEDKGVRIVPEANRTNDNAPTHRVMVGRAEIGAGWAKISNDNRAYLGLKLDDPSFNAPIYANLFDDEDGDTYSLDARRCCQARCTTPSARAS